MKLGKGGQYVVHIGYKYGRVGMKAYASRKFLLSFATVASATALVYLGAIADGVYSAVVIAAVGGYLTANVAQKAVVKPDKE